MIHPRSLTISLLASSVGIPLNQLRFCWQLTGDANSHCQTHYRIRVSSTQDGALQELPDLWDSGRVASDETLFISYSGASLQPWQGGYWSVEVWDEHGKSSGPIAASSYFSIAPQSRQDWQAQWIGATSKDKSGPTPEYFRSAWGTPRPPADLNEESPAVYLRKSVIVHRPVNRAVLSISGLGCYIAGLNDRPSTPFMEWPMAAYDKTVLFRSFDVTEQVKVGVNILWAILGNGLYNLMVPDFFKYEQAVWRGSPRLLCELRLFYRDGESESLVSDASWRVSTKGPIRYNDLRGGETIDGGYSLGNWRNAEFDESRWQPAVLATAPAGTLRPDPTPRSAISEERSPTQIRPLSNGNVMVHFGGPMVGFFRITLEASQTQPVFLHSGEALLEDGSLDRDANTSHTYGRYQIDKIIPGRGVKNNTYETTFSRHAFRYVEIEGLEHPLNHENIRAFRVTIDLQRTSYFSCSDALLMRYHDAARRTLEDCTWGLPCAEPVREKIAWAGDISFLQPAYFYLFNAAALYSRTAEELAFSQHASGHIPPIHPNGGWGKIDETGGHEFCDDPWWGGTLAECIEALELYYGDASAGDRFAARAADYAYYLAGTRAADGCVHWGLGDWCDREWKEGACGLTEVPFTATLGLNRLATLAMRRAQARGDHRHAERLEALATEAWDAVRARYWQDGGFPDHSQTMQALPLSLGLLKGNEKAEAERRLLTNIEATGGLITVGFIGLIPVLRVLAAISRMDIVLNAPLRSSDSGLRFCLENTGEPPTLGETIHAKLIDIHSGAGSYHHQFGATMAAFIYEGLAGLSPTPAAPGWKHFFVRPQMACGLDQFVLRYESPRGIIAVAWDWENDVCSLKVTVPANTTASLLLNYNGREETFLLGPGTHMRTCKK